MAKSQIKLNETDPLSVLERFPERADFFLTIYGSVLDILADSDMKLSEYREIEANRDQIARMFPNAIDSH